MSRLDTFGLAKQAAFGTKQTVMEQFPPMESVSVKDAGKTIEAEETTGVAFPARIEKGSMGYELKASGSLRPASGPRIVSGFMGAPATTTPDNVNAPSARSHLFDPAAAGKDPIPHSLLVNRTDPAPAITDLFWDALGEELTLKVEPSGFVTVDASWFALDLDSTQAEPVATIDASSRLTFDQAKVFLTIDGGAETEEPVAGWSLTYKTGLDKGGEILGTRKLYDLAATNREAELSFTPRNPANLSAHYRRALLADPSKVKVRLTATGATIGGLVAYKLEVIAYLAEILEAPASIAAGSRLASIPVKARCAYDVTSSKFVTVEFVNTTTAY